MADDQDRYPNMTALFAATCGDRDYRVHRRAADSDVAIVAPHGGCIEPGTFELADAIAARAHKFYCFEAIADGLHVTSHRFDDPACLALVEASDHVITVHGCQDSGAVAAPDLTLSIGGRDQAFGGLIRDEIHAHGFAIGHRPELAGVHPLNICNRGRRGMGVQLEFTRSLRDRLMDTKTLADGAFASLVMAVARAIRQQIRRSGQ
jgi:phage replication-related protein YjqB (UPF0714/DUF867 family)